ncbi:MAG: endonuclease/exonuclease/phosphatase family protein [Spirochaetia bacterium]
MKKILGSVVIALIVLLVLLVMCILWGSAKTVSEEEYAEGYIIDGPGDPQTGKSTYSVMTYNAGYASGTANSTAKMPDRDFFDKNLTTMIDMIGSHNPDFLCVQEIDVSSKRSYYVDQVKEFNQKLGYVETAFAPNFSKNYVPFPYWPPSAHWGKVYSGMAVFSSLPLKEQKLTVLDPPVNFSWLYNLFYLDRTIQRTSVNMEGEEVYIFNLHFEAWDGDTREKQAKKLLELYREVKDHPVLIVGDLNVIPPYATRRHNFPMDNYEDEVDYRGEETMEIILSEGSLDTAISKARYLAEEDKYMTYPSDKPHMKIDYILYNSYIRPVRSYVVNENVAASDHRPVYMEFTLQ